MIRIGIVGAGNIAHRFAGSLAHEPRAELVAVSCRSEQKAAAFLDEVEHVQGARGYGSHEELLEDPDVDAIYLSVPHAYHHQWAQRALRAGKAVLCEKPAVLDALEMVEVADVALSEHVLFMEAMKPRFQPIYPLVREALADLGAVREIEATLCNDMLSLVEGSGTYHMTPGPGSGVLLDCGTYCANWIEDLCPKADAVLTDIECVLKGGIDVYVDARLMVGDVTARLECAFDRAKPRRATIVCERGTIEVEELHRPQAAYVTRDGVRRKIDAPYVVDDFFGEVTHFVDLLGAGATESPVMPMASSLGCATMLDVVRDGFKTS